MKPFCRLLAAVALLGAAAVRAQEAPPEEPPAPAAAAPAALFPAGTPAGRPRPVGPSLTASAARKKARRSQFATDAAVTQANSDPLEIRVAYRKAKTLAMARDPHIGDLLDQADAEPTDEGKRARLREYYTLLYKAVRKIDPSPAMKVHVDLLSAASQQRYDPKRRAVSGEDDLAGVGRNGGHSRR